MQYAYIKSRPLNVEEKRRLRISVGIELRLKGTVRHPSRSRIANQLVGFINNPDDGAKNELVNWLFSYGSPKLLGRLANSLASHKTGRQDLEAIKRTGAGRLLPREYITPDFQRIQTSEHPRTALVCFTGNSFRLNMPLQLFHCLVADQFDLIFYLRDPEKQLFTQGIGGVATSLDGLIAELRRQIPAGCHIAAISTSSGGYAAMRFAEEAGAARLAIFSPPLTFRNVPSVSGPARIAPDNARIFFARENKRDVRFASDWGGTGYASAIRWIDTDSHGTLKHVFGRGESRALIKWLRGEADSIQYKKLGKRRSEILRNAVSRLLRFDFRN